MKWILKNWQVLALGATLAAGGLKLTWEMDQINARMIAVESECKSTHDWKIERDSWQKFRQRQRSRGEK